MTTHAGYLHDRSGSTGFPSPRQKHADSHRRRTRSTLASNSDFEEDLEAQENYLADIREQEIPRLRQTINALEKECKALKAATTMAMPELMGYLVRALQKRPSPHPARSLEGLVELAKVQANDIVSTVAPFNTQVKALTVGVLVLYFVLDHLNTRYTSFELLQKNLTYAKVSLESAASEYAKQPISNPVFSLVDTWVHMATLVLASLTSASPVTHEVKVSNPTSFQDSHVLLVADTYYFAALAKMARFYHFFGEPGDSVHCFQAAADFIKLAKTSLSPSALKDPMSFNATYAFYETEHDWMILTLATNRASPIPASKKITLLESISAKSPVRYVASVFLGLLKRDKPIEQNEDSLFSAFKTAEFLRGQEVTAFLHNTSTPTSPTNIPASVPTRFSHFEEHFLWFTKPRLEKILARAGELYFTYCRTGAEETLLSCCYLLQQINSEEFARLEVSIWEYQHLEEYIETAVDIIDHLTCTLPETGLTAYPEALIKAWESRRQGIFSPPMKWPDSTTS